MGPRLRAGLAASTAVLALFDAGRPCRRGRRPLRRHVPAVREGVPPPRPPASATSTRATRRRSRRPIGPRTQLCWVETPTNPLLRLADIRAVAASLRSARRSPVRRQHLHDAVLPAAAGARRRPRRALDDEVPERPLRRRGRRGHRPRSGAARPAGVPAERDGRQPAGLRQLSGACAGPRRWRCAWIGTRPTRWRSRAGWSRAREIARVLYPGLRVASAARARAPPDVGLRRHGQLRVPRRARRARRARASSSRRCGSSPAPSRWAASNRWPSTPRS